MCTVAALAAWSWTSLLPGTTTLGHAMEVQPSADDAVRPEARIIHGRESKVTDRSTGAMVTSRGWRRGVPGLPLCGPQHASAPGLPGMPGPGAARHVPLLPGAAGQSRASWSVRAVAARGEPQCVAPPRHAPTRGRRDAVHNILIAGCGTMPADMRPLPLRIRQYVMPVVALV